MVITLAAWNFRNISEYLRVSFLRISFMMTSSNGTFSALRALCAENSPVKSPHKGQWCGALMFCLICAWIHSWVNHRAAGDLRRHRAHYDVIVMLQVIFYYEYKVEVSLSDILSSHFCQPLPRAVFFVLSNLIFLFELCRVHSYFSFWNVSANHHWTNKLSSYQINWHPIICEVTVTCLKIGYT